MLPGSFAVVFAKLPNLIGIKTKSKASAPFGAEALL